MGKPKLNDAFFKIDVKCRLPTHCTAYGATWQMVAQRLRASFDAVVHYVVKADTVTGEEAE